MMHTAKLLLASLCVIVAGCTSAAPVAAPQGQEGRSSDGCTGFVELDMVEAGGGWRYPVLRVPPEPVSYDGVIVELEWPGAPIVRIELETLLNDPEGAVNITFQSANRLSFSTSDLFEYRRSADPPQIALYDGAARRIGGTFGCI